MQPKAYSRSQEDQALRSAPQHASPFDDSRHEAGPSRLRLSHVPRGMARTQSPVSDSAWAKSSSRATGHMADDGSRLSRHRDTGNRHRDTDMDTAQTYRYRDDDRPYVSPVSPDPPGQSVLSSNPPRLNTAPEDGYRHRKDRARDDGATVPSVHDARYGSTAYLSRQSQAESPIADSSAYTQGRSRGPTVVGWTPSDVNVKTEKPFGRLDREVIARQKTRLDQLLYQSGRPPAEWPEWSEVEHILHWADDLLIECFRNSRWRPPPASRIEYLQHPQHATPHSYTSPERAHPGSTHQSPATRTAGRMEAVPDWHPAAGWTSRQPRRGQEDVHIQRHPAVPPPPQMHVLAPSYELDPTIGYRPTTALATVGSLPHGRGYSGSSTMSGYDVYALDDTPRRARMLMTPDQQRVLQGLWRITRFPNLQQREECGEAVGLTNRQVQVWFQNQRQKARKQTQQGAEHAYSAELAQRGRPVTHDGGDSTSSSRPNSRGSDALGLVLEEGRGGERGNQERNKVVIAQPASKEPGFISHSKAALPQTATLQQMTSLNPFGIPSADRDRQYGLPSLRNLLNETSPPKSSSSLPPLRTSPSKYDDAHHDPIHLGPAFSPAPGLRRPSISHGNTPKSLVRQRYSPLIPAQSLADRPEIQAGKRHSQPYLKTISTSTTSSTGMKWSPPRPDSKPLVSARTDGSWGREYMGREGEVRTPREGDDDQSINLQ